MPGRHWPISEGRRYTTAPLADFCHAFKHPDEYQWHCFVRNPYSRVLSAWNDKLVKGFYSDEYPRSMRKLVPRIRKWADEQGLDGATEEAPLPFATFFLISNRRKKVGGTSTGTRSVRCSALTVSSTPMSTGLKMAFPKLSPVCSSAQVSTGFGR